MSYFGSSRIQEGAAGLGDTTPGSFMPPVVRASREGSLGEYFSANGLGASPSFYRPGTRSFREGSLGRTFYRPGTRSFQEGSIGEYFAANGLGATAADPNVLDLKDPAVLTELKSMMAVSAYNEDGVPVAITDEGVTRWDEAWYKNGVWDDRADELWRLIDSTFRPLAAGVSDPTLTSGEHIYPSPTGVASLAVLSAPHFGKGGLTTAAPVVSAWIASFQNTSDLVAAGTVAPPRFKPSRYASAMMWTGAAGVAAVGAFLVFGGKKKRRPYMGY